MSIAGSNCRQLLRAATTTKPIKSARFNSTSSLIPQRQLLTTIASLLYRGNDSKPTPEEVTVSGWIRSVRKMKNVTFVHLGDGSTSTPCQVVLSPEQSSSNLTTGASIQVTGKWKESLNKNVQSAELQATAVRVLGEADPMTFPMQNKYHTPEYLRTMPHLRMRLVPAARFLQLRSWVIENIQSFFSNNEFVQTHPPILTSSDCEGAGEVFEVNAGKGKDLFFGRHTYLTVSTQLHLEAFAQAVGRAWTLSPTFRAEKSDTARHLSEFYMLEAEIAFTEKLDDVMDILENMLRSLVTGLSQTRLGKEMLLNKNRPGEDSNLDVDLEQRWKGLMQANWTRMSYTEAVKILEEAAAQDKSMFKFEPGWGSALQAEHERYIASHYGNGGPVFVTDYPTALKPFYMLPTQAPDNSQEQVNDDRRTVACFDLLVPEMGELAGGSLREHRLDELKSAMRTHNLLSSSDDDKGEFGPLDWYVDLRKYGTVQHGGYGLGFERLLGYLAGISNIREASAFPRWFGRCDS